MKTVFAGLILCIHLSSVYAAAPNYSMTARTRIFRGDPSVLVNEDTHTDAMPVSASASRLDGGTTAEGDATAGFNQLHVKSSSVAADLSSTLLAVISLAEWNDRLFFKRNGQDITVGDIAVSVHLKGEIEFQPPLLDQWLTFNVSLGNAGTGVAVGQSRLYDEISELGAQHRGWSPTDGLALRFTMFSFASNERGVLSALADFSAGAAITNIALLGPNGQPDPLVSVIGASGLIYSVPEPHFLSMAILMASSFLCVRRLRTGRPDGELSPIATF